MATPPYVPITEAAADVDAAVQSFLLPAPVKSTGRIDPDLRLPPGSGRLSRREHVE